MVCLNVSIDPLMLWLLCNHKFKSFVKLRLGHTTEMQTKRLALGVSHQHCVETGYLFCCLFFFYTIPNYNIYYFSAKPLHYSFKATFFSWKINEIKFRAKLPGQRHAPHLGHLQPQHKLCQCQIWTLYAQNSFPCLKNNALLILLATAFINLKIHKVLCSRILNISSQLLTSGFVTSLPRFNNVFAKSKDEKSMFHASITSVGLHV